MDAKALAALELPAIAERLAVATSTPPGEELARLLAPSSDPEEVGRRQALTAEAIALLEDSAAPPLRGVEDVRPAAARAARGGLLSPAELAGVGATIAGALAARAALGEREEDAPLLNGLAAAIDPGLRPLAETIRSRVEADGSDLKDAASPELRRLRRQLRDGRGRIADELRKLARRAGVREHLQEDFITQRGGRPVLAVKVGARSAVPGVVHDASSSGETLFVEPFEIVELSNRESESAGAEREEAERILQELTATVGARADGIGALVAAAAEIDLALARGALSRSWRGAPVQPSAEVNLTGARHPLLDPASAVPIDLELGSLRALVLSGPNTGGKTVALKTLGLVALLHQAGLRPPAESAALPVFDRVLADIGDPQSIEMSLSTFSGHVRALVEVLDAATERSLVLLDEVASGTDPVEGSALAQALVARLAGQARLTVVTTHHPELKEWASATEGVANAATGIDPESHEPLYRIVLGRPGTSHALATAERLGLDPGVVADARGRVAPERLRIAELLAEAEAAERDAAAARVEAEAERRDAASAVESVHRREAELAGEIERVRASAGRERERALARAEQELAGARAELAALRAEIRAARRLQERARQAAPERAASAERDRDRRLGEASERAAQAQEALRALRPVALQGPLAPGDPVTAPDLGVRGTVAAIEGDEAEVVGLGGQRVRIPVARLQADERPQAEPEPAVKVVAGARSDVSDQLDLRGRRADEAREAVRAFVDDAVLAGLGTVRVVHGRGTGAVRAAVREELGRHPLVEGFEADAAGGATDVTLAGARP
ncbi:MAG TPA: Smr/MutS family protein [Gaiellaceae bacterium]|nr:Smr/MutS family protein [Gaiellaceae bacterium]